MKKQWENPRVSGRGQYIVGVKALPNGYAFVGSDIFPQLPSLYGIFQNKGYFLSENDEDEDDKDEGEDDEESQ